MIVLLMITTQAYQERSAHVAKEKQAEQQTDRTCNRPYLAFIDNFATQANQNTEMLPPLDSPALQNVPLAYTSWLPWSRERAYKRGSPEQCWLRPDPRTRWHSKTDIREISLSQCRSPSLTVASQARGSESATRRESQHRQDRVEHQYRVAWRSRCTKELTEELEASVTVNRGPWSDYVHNIIKAVQCTLSLKYCRVLLVIKLLSFVRRKSQSRHQNWAGFAPTSRRPLYEVSSWEKWTSRGRIRIGGKFED